MVVDGLNRLALWKAEVSVAHETHATRRARHTSSWAIASGETVSSVTSTASFFVVPLSRSEWASTRAPEARHWMLEMISGGRARNWIGHEGVAHPAGRYRSRAAIWAAASSRISQSKPSTAQRRGRSAYVT